MSFARRSFIASLTFTAAVALAAISLPSQAQDKKDLTIGATAGPYADQVKFGIKPILEKKGYRVKVVEFNDYIQPNFALAQGSLDANAFQHIVYLTKFATENKLALSELLKVPTAPIAIYSKKHKTLDVKEGAVVALPNDPTNAARALVVLEQIGNFALASGLKLTEALALEKTSATYQNLVAVRTEDLGRAWVKDIADAYRSREFLAITETRFAGFVKTDYQQASSAAASR